nr:putative ribonuclease H-like domain-containing protein [Tanacetum cinerariifolium]
FKLLDENQVLLRVPGENNMYNVDLKNIVSSGDLTCLFSKATLDESNLWHRRLGRINFKTMNKLVKGNLVRGLPTKVFKNNHTCVACKKVKQHRASCKNKPVCSVNQPLQRLHMDLFRPTFVKSLNKKSYCLVVTDDYSRFTWVFFLAAKDETSSILKIFITCIENQLSLKVKIIRCDNGTEFKNSDLNQLCGMKGIKRKFSVPRSPQQNGIGERKNMTLIEAARTMLADSLLPIPFWAEAVNTACYVHNRILVTKPQNKTSYELLLGKFDGKVDEGFLVGYSVSSKAFRNTDRDTTFDDKDPGFEGRKPPSIVHVSSRSSAQTKKHDDKTKREAKGKIHVESSTGYRNLSAEFKDFSDNNINEDNAAGTLVPAVEKSLYVDSSQLPDDPNMPKLEDIAYSNDEEDVGAEADFTNLSMTRVAKDQGGLSQINNDDFHTCMFACFLSQEESKRVHQDLKDPSWIEAMQEELLQFKMQKVWVLVDLPHGKKAIGHIQEEGIDYEEVFAPVARIEAIRLYLAYASFIGFMMYQMDVKSAFMYGTIEKEVYVCQPPGFKDPDYPDKVYKVVKALYGLHQAPRAWYETLTNYLLENGFQRRKIDQTLFIKRQKCDILLVQIYVDDIIFCSANKDLCKAFEKLMKDKFQISLMGELTFFLGQQVKQKKDGIFISQNKYAAKILRKFGFTDGKSAIPPIVTKKPLLKDPDGEDVDVHTYRLMIGSLMYLTSSRPDIMFAVCACAHFQVTPKASHLHAVKMIFRYLKGKPHLGLWYPKDSPFNLVAYSDSDYASASLDRNSTTGGCQFLGCRLISWQCKKLNVTAVSSKFLLFEGIDYLPNEEIFAELSRMGYEKPSTKLTFYKAFFSPQWKFLIHTILQCMSAKRTSWNEFSSSMASAVICLSTGLQEEYAK